MQIVALIPKAIYIYILKKYIYIYVTCHVSHVACHMSHVASPMSQPFQRFIPIMDIATFRLNQPRGQCSENYLKCIRMWERRYGVTISIFSIIQGMDTRPAVYKNTPLLGFEINKIMFRPNSDTFSCIFGLPRKNQN